MLLFGGRYVKNLTMPDVDNLDLWKRIVSNKNLDPRRRLFAIENKIQNRYQTYTTNKGSLSTIKPSTDTAIMGNKTDLISCYGDNVNFVPIKKQLLSLSHKCPYCCINRPNTLDQYFDKSEYPEFSVFVPNLMPCCSECNGTKNTYVFGSNGERIFLHYYFDKIPDYQFVFMRFSVGSDGIPIVKAYLEFEEQTELTDVIDRHFSKLSLLNKYQECVKDRLPVLLSQINGHKNNLPTNSIKEILTVQYKSFLEANGANYWETCLYEGILNSPSFLDQYLSQEKFCAVS